jgi:molybdopterin synthase sulfur carrier subunit
MIWSRLGWTIYGVDNLCVISEPECNSLIKTASANKGAWTLAKVFIPSMLQTLTGGAKQVDCDARNVRQLDRLEELYPGVKDRLVEDGEIRRNLAVAIDGEVAIMGMLQKVGETSEVHFVPAIGGGR